MDVVVPPRAPLPADTPNLVTPRGLALLRAELAELEALRAEKQRTSLSSHESARELAIVDGQLALLRTRLDSAEEVAPPDPRASEVLFGSTATVRFHDEGRDGAALEVTIVGVDEAGCTAGSVSFLSPIAIALLGKRAGDRVLLAAAGRERQMDVLSVTQSQH